MIPTGNPTAFAQIGRTFLQATSAVRIAFRGAYAAVARWITGAPAAPAPRALSQRQGGAADPLANPRAVVRACKQLVAAMPAPDPFAPSYSPQRTRGALLAWLTAANPSGDSGLSRLIAPVLAEARASGKSLTPEQVVDLLAPVEPDEEGLLTCTLVAEAARRGKDVLIGALFGQLMREACSDPCAPGVMSLRNEVDRLLGAAPKQPAVEAEGESLLHAAAFRQDDSTSPDEDDSVQFVVRRSDSKQSRPQTSDAACIGAPATEQSSPLPQTVDQVKSWCDRTRPIDGGNAGANLFRSSDSPGSAITKAMEPFATVMLEKADQIVREVLVLQSKDPGRSQDDLLLEVTSRHLVGEEGVNPLRELVPPEQQTLLRSIRGIVERWHAPSASKVFTSSLFLRCASPALGKAAPKGSRPDRTLWMKLSKLVTTLANQSEGLAAKKLGEGALSNPYQRRLLETSQRFQARIRDLEQG